MKRYELEIEHSYKNKFVGKHRIKPESEFTIIGSCRESNIRLLGEDVSGVHALLDWNGENWVVNDLGSEHGTWIQRQPIVETEIKGATHVRIGSHVLKLVPKIHDEKLFEKNVTSAESKGNKVYHQVVIRRYGVILESHLLEPTQSLDFQMGSQSHLIKPGQSFEWQKQNFGDLTIQNRLVRSNHIEETTQERVKTLVDPEMKKPGVAALVMILLLLMVFVFAPNAPDDELKEVKPERNRYTRIIYDAKSVKKRKAASKKLVKNIATKRATAKPAKAKATGVAAKRKSSKSPGAKVAKKIKAAGLSKLIGKISKRAAKNADFIQAAGRSPDSKSTGRALGRVGNATIGEAAKGNAAGSGYKIGGVSTGGKGGGSSAYKGAGGLALGNVGNAEVGVLDEETEVQGGLDRDVIARVIRSQLGQIRYCYERQLSANPDLYGKVMVKFTIGAAGGVVTQSIGATSLSNAMVEGCILRRIAGWKFPEPRGGTSVLVTYPFLFKSTK